MRWQSVVVAAAFAALTYAFWGFVNQPTSEPAWPSKIQGFAFSPYQAGQDATRDDMPTEAQLESDLELLSGKTNAVRTYSTLGSLGTIPQLARKHGLNVTVGTWIDNRLGRNQQEIANAVRLARDNRNVVRVLIGNEVVLRNDVPLELMYEYLDRARQQIGQPVSTAEPWHVWLKNPELAEHVDFLMVHLLPYWEGIEVEQAVQYSIERMELLQRTFPDKPIVIGEVGWPSNGRTRDSSVASVANEALFLRRFLSHAEEKKWIYYVMEAFDQPWKEGIEGAVGAYWGVYDVNRQAKFPFTEPIVRMPEWRTLAGLSVVLALIALAVLYVNSRALRTSGRGFLAVVVYATATAAVWVFYDYSQQYLTLTSTLIGLLMFLGTLGVILVLFTEAHEWAEARWVTTRQRLLNAAPHRTEPAAAGSGALPKVSIHVPAYNEPAAMLIETLEALAQLDYPDFEVLVIDNNTVDEAVWRPVETRCAELGPRFRFFHVAPLEGFKAGALNFALRHTAPDAAIVAVIDSDYVVDRAWLRTLIPAFADPQIAIVQAPQDYRDAGESAFKAMAYAEYRGFFQVGMVTRNERNAIIQHGTMTLVRRDVLDDVSRWAEWCICEDTELGLSVFEAGYGAHYTSRSFGRGLMPDTFVDFKKQRFRWAYGAMQILKAHWPCLNGNVRSQLAPGQRYHFIAGWLPWIADGFNLLFNFAAITWSILMIASPLKYDAPLMMFSVLPLSLFAFKLVKLVHLYRSAVGANLRQTLAAALAGLSLSHTIGFAVLKGLTTRNEPFFRTPKNASRQGLARAIGAAREETLMLVALLLATWGVARIPITSSPDLETWKIVLAIQAVPYGCSLLVSLVSALSLPSWLVGTTYREPRATAAAAEVATEKQDSGPAAGEATVATRTIADASPAVANAASVHPALASAATAAAAVVAAMVGAAAGIGASAGADLLVEQDTLREAGELRRIDESSGDRPRGDA
ncbi:MAG: glycosyltransferase [Sinobacteraceae bacterium]|nr:glycosyltransferase [Nevskiaceae bacterium]MCP5466861.1 glycosyltransferase [Nevskiaceae bacterium]MCP5470950.1 glycosyltransferase [Nevskiaceae bacterium]